MCNTQSSHKSQSILGVIALPAHLSVGSEGCRASAMDVDAVAGCSSWFFFFLATISTDMGHDLLTFLVLGMIEVKSGQGLVGINEIKFGSLWESAQLVRAKEWFVKI